MILLIHSIRNILTSRFKVFNFSLRIFTNSHKSKLVLFSREVMRILWRASFKILHYSFTVSSPSLIQLIILSKIRLNKRIDFYFRMRVIYNTVLMARHLIFGSLLLRQRRIIETICISNATNTSGKGCRLRIRVSITSSPTIFWFMSEALINLLVKTCIMLCIP
jgi:hypothetical protein